MMRSILIITGWFMAVGLTGYIWGTTTTLASNFVKVKRVCDLCFRNIKEWNEIYHRNAPGPDSEGDSRAKEQPSVSKPTPTTEEGESTT